MISINKLVLSDFLSFKELNIDLPHIPYTILILGINKTDKGQKSNGSGKSAIQAAIEYSLTGSCSRKVRNIGLIRKGCQEASVSLIFTDSQKQEKVVIERTIPSKGSATVKITVNDSPVEYSDLNEWLLKYLQISRQDLTNYFLPNEISYVSFFSNSDTKKKEIISRFTGSESINRVFVELDNKIKQSSESVKVTESKIIAHIARLEMLDNMIKDDQFDPEKIRKEKIDELIEQIDMTQEEISTLETTNTAHQSKIDTISFTEEDLLNKQKGFKKELSKITDVEDEEITLIEEEVLNIRKNKSKLLTNVSEVEDSQNELDNDISTCKRTLKGAIECPECGAEFNPASEKSLEEVQTELKDLESQKVLAGKLHNKLSIKIKEVDTVLQEKNKHLTDLIAKQEKIRKQKQSINKQIADIDSELASLKVNFTTLNSKIQANNDSIKNLKKEIKALKNKIVEVESQELVESERLIKLKSDLESEQKSKITTEQQLELAKVTLSNFESKEKMFIKFKSYLVNRKLKIIESAINNQLNLIQSDLQIFVDGFKMLADGRLKENITAQIIKEGEIVEYGSLSKGERVRVDMCTLLTLQDFINQSCSGGGLNFMFCDEITDGLDLEGLESLLKSLSVMNKNIMFTTQLPMEEVYDNCLVVEKVNGISKIRE